MKNFATLTVGDKVSIRLGEGESAAVLYDLIVKVVESDQVVLVDSLGPVTVMRTAGNVWRAEGKVASVVAE